MDRFERRLLTPLLSNDHGVFYDDLIDFTVNNLSCEFGDKTLFSSITFTLNSNDGILAIIGPPNSGKTTLLSGISGRLSYGTLSGNLSINSKTLSNIELRSIIGFAPQNNLYIDLLNVNETLYISARLYFPFTISDESIDRRIDVLLAELNFSEYKYKQVKTLTKANLRILSIIKVLLIHPKIIIVDEPIGDLDVYTSELIMSALLNESRTDKIIICSCQYPRSIVLNKCQKVLLLGQEGQVIYFGEKEEALHYFEAFGLVKPAEYSVGEFLLDIVTDSDPGDISHYCYSYLQSNEYKQLVHSLDSCSLNPISLPDAKLGFYNEFRTLFYREFIMVIRNYQYFIAHCITSILFGLWIGVSFLRLKNDYFGTVHKTGLIFFSVIFASLLSFTALRVSQEKDVIKYQLIDGNYKVQAYMLTWFLNDFIFLRFIPLLFYAIPVIGLTYSYYSLGTLIVVILKFVSSLSLISMVMVSLIFLSMHSFEFHSSVFVTFFYLLISILFSKYVIHMNGIFHEIIRNLSIIDLGFHLLLEIFFPPDTSILFNPIHIPYPSIILGKNWIDLYYLQSTNLSLEIIIIFVLVIVIISFLVISYSVKIKSNNNTNAAPLNSPIPIGSTYN